MYYLRGNAYRVKGNYDLYMRGSAGYDKGIFKQAFSDYTRAIELDPKLVDAYLGRARVYIDQGNNPQINIGQEDYDQAKADLTKATELYLGNAEAYYLRGGVNRRQGLTAQAISDYEMYLRLIPNASNRAQVEQWLRDVGAPSVMPVAPVSFPVVTSGPGRCRLTVDFASPDGTVFKISGEGFEPNEEFAATSQSGNELFLKLKASSDGTWSSVVRPAVIDKTEGSASFAAAGKNCNLKVNYAWGALALAGPPRRLENAELIKIDPRGAGLGELTITNSTFLDALAVIVENNVTSFSIYIRARSSYTYRIWEGTYEFFYMLGEDWDKDALKFTRQLEYHRQIGQVTFSRSVQPRVITVNFWRPSLSTGSSDPSLPLISADQFPSVK